MNTNLKKSTQNYLEEWYDREGRLISDVDRFDEGDGLI